MNNKPLVSIILVNWNGKEHLKTCLRSLGKVTHPSYETILVDNASTDGSLGWVRSTYPDIRIVPNNRNLGFAGGNNSGLSPARGKYILLLNTDTIVDKTFLQPLVNVLEQDPSIGVVQPKVLLASDSTKIDSVGSFFLPNGLLYHYGREKNGKMPIYNIPMDIFSAKGVCMLIRREIIDRIGLFDKDFFSYFEETDFCMRVWLAGFRVRYEPSANIVHFGGATSSKQPKPFILFHASKNVLCTYLKNLSFFYALRVIPIIMGLYGLWCIANICTGKFANVWAIVHAFIWNTVQMRNTLRKRETVQKHIRVRQDKDFLPALIHPVAPQYYVEQFFGNLGSYRDQGILPETA